MPISDFEQIILIFQRYVYFLLLFYNMSKKVYKVIVLSEFHIPRHLSRFEILTRMANLKMTNSFSEYNDLFVYLQFISSFFENSFKYTNLNYDYLHLKLFIQNLIAYNSSKISI